MKHMGRLGAVPPAVFQFLFYWILTRPDDKSDHRGWFLVSILVMVEYPSELIVMCGGQKVAMEFQSLFWWNVLLNGPRGETSHDEHLVSILVLLE